jgi:hypothetical protein
MSDMAIEEISRPAAVARPAEDALHLQWTPIIAGAFGTAALSLVLITFAVTIGLGVSSTSPTWRDTSVALAILSGLYLILQAIASFGLGGYIAGRTRRSHAAARTEGVESADGMHGLATWALAVLLGAALAALVGASGLNRPAASESGANASRAEPLLSYELDRLFRSPRRAPNADIGAERAEAGRILLTSSSHDGVSADDRSYLVQQVAATTGLSPADADKRVSVVIEDSRTAIAKSRHSAVILAFSLAAATLLGAVTAWMAACAGGRHRDGAPLPEWMEHANRFERSRPILPS